VIESVWLEIDDVLLAQRVAIDLFGGLHGIRDQSALESALAQPQAGSGDQLFHETVFEQAAAYAYHIIRNHPFIDGNKRAGLAAARIFLGLNGWFLAEAVPDSEQIILGVADGSVSKPVLAEFFRSHSITRIG
jgi:death-on-curing protein